jgi:hypothetical protein
MDKMEYNIAQNLLPRGTSCWVRVGENASDAANHIVGFVDSMNGTKQIQLQRANVCGSIVPASIDAQAISVNLSLTGFVASAAVYNGTETFNGGGTVSLSSFNPDSDDFIKNEVMTKFPYLDFYDDKTGDIIASFKDVIPSSYRVTIQGGSYVKADIQMEAIWMSSGKDYTQTI